MTQTSDNGSTASRLTITEAAKLTGKSPDAIRRAIKRDRSPLATTRDLATGAYLTTRADLEAAGFQLLEADHEAERSELEQLRRELAQLTQEQAADRQRIYDLTAERDRANSTLEAVTSTLEATRAAIQALTIATAQLAPATDSESYRPPASDRPARSGLFRRR